MRKYVTALMALSLGATGIARAQCVTYSLGYAVYTSYSLDNVQPGQGAPIPGMGWITISGAEQSEQVQVCHRWLAGGDCQQWITEYIYDTGTVSITVNGITESTTYGAGSTASTIASALAAAFNADPYSFVTAANSGAAIQVTAKTNGAGTNYALSATSYSSRVATFGGPSFSAAPSGSTLTGGGAGTLGDLLTSTLIDGSADMTLDQATCPYPEYENLLNELPNATHTPFVSNTVNGVGSGMVSGTPVCVTCYLSEQYDSTDPITLELPDNSASSIGQVYCSVGGLIFVIEQNPYFEFAFTWMLKNGLPLIVGPTYIYPVTQNCSNGTPDWYPATVQDKTPDAPFDVTFLTGSFMVRASTTAYWTSILGFTIVTYPSAYPPEPCVHTGPQI